MEPKYSFCSATTKIVFINVAKQCEISLVDLQSEL